MNYDDWKLATPPYEEDVYCESCNELICIMNESKIKEICQDCYDLLN